MKKLPTMFLQIIIVLIGIGALSFMLWEPHLEGRNIGATFFEIYFKDPFLAYVYIGSTPFFIALYKAFKLFGYIERGEVFSANSIQALETIQRCAISLVGLVLLPLAYLVIIRPEDDIAGGVAMGLVVMFISTTIAVSATVLKRVLQNKS